MRKPLLVASVVIHAGAFAALAIAAMWRIEKLPLEDHGGVVASFALPQDPGGGAAQQKPKLVPKEEKKVLEAPKDTVQPEKRKTDLQVKDSDDDVGKQLGNETGDKPGNGTGGTGDGTLAPNGDCAAPPCEEKKKEDPIIPKTQVVVEKEEPIIIAETEVKRISGDSRIEAPNSVKLSMQRAGEKKVSGAVKLCVDTDGRVTSATTRKSTGYDAYDDKLASAMRSWRYQPLIRDGKEHAFCTSIVLVYIMQ